MKSTTPPLRHTLQGTTQVFFAESLVLPTGFFITVFLTHRLGPAGFGLFTLAASLVGWVAWVVASLFSRATVKFVSEAADWRPIAGVVIRLQLVFGALSLFVLWLLADPISVLFREPLLAGYLRLFALEVPFFCLFNSQQHILVGLGRFGERAWTSAVRWISRLFFIVLFVGLGFSVPGAILGVVVAALLSFLIVQRRLWFPVLGSAASAASGLWAYALPLFFSAFSLRLYERLDLFALKALGASASQAGIYGAAQSLSWIPGLFALSFSPLLISTLSRLWRAEEVKAAREMITQSLRIGFLLWPFAALASGSSAEIVSLIFGPNFSEAGTLFSLLIFAAVAMVIISVVTSIFTALGKPGWALLLTAPLIPLALAGHLSLIPRWGSIGAALVTTVSALCLAAISLAFASRAGQISLPYFTLARSLLLSVVAFALTSLWPTSGLFLLLKLATGGIVIVAGFLLLGELSRGEISLLRAATRLPLPSKNP